MDITLEDIKYKSKDHEKLNNLYEELEFYSFLKKEEKSYDKPKVTVNIIDNMNKVKLDGEYAVYLEMLGTNYHVAKPLGLSFYNDKNSFYITFDNFLKNPIFGDNIKYTYDLKKLYVTLKWHNIDINNVVFDTEIAAYLLDYNVKDDIAYLADLSDNELFEELLNFDYYESSYDVLNEGVSEFFKSMDDDFSTPKAIAAIFSFIKKSNKDLNEEKIIIDDLLAIKHWFADISQILGIDFFANDDETSGDEEELLNIIADGIKKNKKILVISTQLAGGCFQYTNRIIINWKERCEFVMPDKCPVCGAPVYQEPGEVAIRCGNFLCPAHLTRRIIHFASREALNIEGLGDKVAQALVDQQCVHNPLDLYKVSGNKCFIIGNCFIEYNKLFTIYATLSLKEVIIVYT